jgi:UDP-N-acetylglucosamine transferase subunit ALG13
VRTIYIESVSRVNGPSLSGRILAHIPRIELYTQHEHWADERWSYRFSVFDAFVMSTHAALTHTPSDPARRAERLSVFVTLGTIRPYRFDALVVRAEAALLQLAGEVDLDVTWQLGVTERQPKLGRHYSEIPASEMQRLSADADLVITHAGVATCLQLVQMNKRPIVVPRRASRREHVDDHQAEIATELADRGLSITTEVDDLEEVVLTAARSLLRSRQKAEQAEASRHDEGTTHV